LFGHLNLAQTALLAQPAQPAAEFDLQARTLCKFIHRHGNGKLSLSKLFPKFLCEINILLPVSRLWVVVIADAAHEEPAMTRSSLDKTPPDRFAGIRRDYAPH